MLVIETLENDVCSVSIVDFEQVNVRWVAEIGDSDKWVNVMFALNRVQLESTQISKMELFAKIFNG